MQESDTTPKEAPSEPAKQPANSRKKIYLWLTIVILFVAILIGTPFAIQYAIQSALLKAGANTVTLEDVNFNPFAGELEVINLNAQTGDEPELTLTKLKLSLDWLPLFSKQVMVRSFELQGMSLDVEQLENGAIRVAGILLPKSTEPSPDTEPSAWGFGIGQLDLADNVINFQTPDFTTHSKLSDVSLTQLISWSPDSEADFSIVSTVNDAHLSGDIKLNLFTQTPTISGQLKIDKLDLSDFVELAGDNIQTLKAKLSTDMQFALKLGKDGLHYQQNGMVSLHDLDLATADIRVMDQLLSYSGDFSFDQTDTQVDLSGKLSAQTLNASLSQPAINASVNQADWDGQVHFHSQDEQPVLTANGGFKTGAAQIVSNKDQFLIAGLAALSIDQLDLAAIDQLKAKGIQLDQLKVASKSASSAGLLEAEKLSIASPEWGPNQDLIIDSIELSKTRSMVRLDKQGQLPLLQQLQQSLATDPRGDSAAPTEATASDTPKPRIVVGSVALVDSTIVNVQIDTEVEAIKKQINLKTATIGRMDSAKPNAETPVLINSVIDKHATLKSEGFIKPFSDKSNLKLKTDIKALDLHDFSPIIKQHIGYNITSGQLNADSQLAITDDVIDGKNKLTINQMQVASANSSATEKLNQQLSMPLDSALDLLRDGDGDIQLNVPLSGNINAPNFDLGDIINQAIGGALKGTTTNLLKLALQPYGLIFMAAEKALEASASISLEPIVFEPGSTALVGNATDYLDKISGLMAQRPGIRIRICGVSTETDRAALASSAEKTNQDAKKSDQDEAAKMDEPLLQLATDRADAVRGHLIEKHQVSVERLFTCLPKITQDAEVKPQVQLLI